MSLFAEPQRQPRRLSRLYAADQYRAWPGRVCRYARYSGRLDCDECMAEQHEGAPFRTRARATVRRTVNGDAELLLCSHHLLLWDERDEHDGRGQDPVSR